MAAALFSEKEQPLADTEQPLAASPPPLAYSSRAWSCPWPCPWSCPNEKQRHVSGMKRRRINPNGANG